MARICDITGKKVMVGNNVSTQTERLKESFIQIYRQRSFLFLSQVNG